MVYINNVLWAFISVSLSEWNKNYGSNIVWLRTHSIHYQIVTKRLFYWLHWDFLACRYFFWYSFSFYLPSLDILRYLFLPYSLFLFFCSLDKFLYLSLAWCLNLLLFSVSHLCFFNNTFLKWTFIQYSCTHQTQWNCIH